MNHESPCLPRSPGADVGPCVRIAPNPAHILMIAQVLQYFGQANCNVGNAPEWMPPWRNKKIGNPKP